MYVCIIVYCISWSWEVISLLFNLSLSFVIWENKNQIGTSPLVIIFKFSTWPDEVLVRTVIWNICSKTLFVGKYMIFDMTNWKFRSYNPAYRVAEGWPKLWVFKVFFLLKYLQKLVYLRCTKNLSRRISSLYCDNFWITFNIVIYLICFKSQSRRKL